jgi:hypothetical protein
MLSSDTSTASQVRLRRRLSREQQGDRLTGLDGWRYPHSWSAVPRRAITVSSEALRLNGGCLVLLNCTRGKVDVHTPLQHVVVVVVVIFTSCGLEMHRGIRSGWLDVLCM